MRCKYCGADTQMAATRLCDRCYEIVVRVQANPELVERILDAERPYSVMVPAEEVPYEFKRRWPN